MRNSTTARRTGTTKAGPVNGKGYGTDAILPCFRAIEATQFSGGMLPLGPTLAGCQQFKK
jgi:hypothetical protein